MTFEEKSAIVISQLRADRDRLQDAIDKIRAEIEEYMSSTDNAISEDELEIKGMKVAYADCLKIIDEYMAESETYGYCAYHEIECDYSGSCIDCPHNTQEDAEWFRQDEESAESEE